MRRSAAAAVRTFGGEAMRSSTAKLVPANETPREGQRTGGDSAKKGLRNMEQQIKREVATQVAAVSPVGARKREVAAPQKQAGLSTQDLILIAVLLAAGAVLKLTVGSLLSSMGMKPNFVIAMYCLAIILTRPKVGQAVVIGLLAGHVC